MINELEKKSSFNAMSDLEITKNSIEMLRYRNNRLAYALGLSGVALSLLAAFVCMNSMNPENFQVIFKIILNVFIFWSLVKGKLTIFKWFLIQDSE